MVVFLYVFDKNSQICLEVIDTMFKSIDNICPLNIIYRTETKSNHL